MKTTANAFPTILLLFCVSVLFNSCSSSLKLNRVQVLVRELNTGEALPGTKVRVESTAGQTLGSELQTDSLGYLTFKLKKLEGFSQERLDQGDFQMIFSKQFPSGTHKKDSAQLNKYVPFYDLYLDSEDVPKGTLKSIDPTQLVADMHYHVSMRTRIFSALLFHIGL